MYDSFSKSVPVSSVINRRSHPEPQKKFSPSFAVRHGLIKDPNWPPAEFPESGNAAARRTRRVEANFEVELRGEVHRVHGDISEGGAMFILDRQVDTRVVDIVVKGKAARAEVLTLSRRGTTFAHHCRFLDVNEARPVWEAVVSS
jgi:hypothetical protein